MKEKETTNAMSCPTKSPEASARWKMILSGVIFLVLVVAVTILMIPVMRLMMQEGGKEQLIEKLVNFKGVPQELDLPSAPKQFIRYMEEDNRPQVTLDVNYENGMGVSVGRLREDTVYDYKFVGLSHNTVRGAAGGAVLCAETLKAKGFITKK